MSEQPQKCNYSIPDCTICMEPLLNDIQVIRMCGHVFHSTCILQHFEHKQECPNCRQKVQKSDKYRSIQLQAFEIAEETQEEKEMRNLVDNLKGDDQEKFLQMMQEHGQKVKQNIKLQKENDELKEQNQTMSKKIQEQDQKLTIIEKKAKSQASKAQFWQGEAEKFEQMNDENIQRVQNMSNQIDKFENELEAVEDIRLLQVAIENNKDKEFLQHYEKNHNEKQLIQRLKEDIYIQKGKTSKLETQVKQISNQGADIQREYNNQRQLNRELQAKLERMQEKYENLLDKYNSQQKSSKYTNDIVINPAVQQKKKKLIIDEDSELENENSQMLSKNNENSNDNTIKQKSNNIQNQENSNSNIINDSNSNTIKNNMFNSLFNSKQNNFQNKLQFNINNKQQSQQSDSLQKQKLTQQQQQKSQTLTSVLTTNKMKSVNMGSISLLNKGTGLSLLQKQKSKPIIQAPLQLSNVNQSYMNKFSKK